MSDTEEMVRLMEHAASVMGARVDAMLSAKSADHHVGIAEFRDVVALSYGRAMLQMVAASVAPEARARLGQLADRVREDYLDWAEQNNGVAMSDGELESVSRFVRSLIGEPS